MQVTIEIKPPTTTITVNVNENQHEPVCPEKLADFNIYQNTTGHIDILERGHDDMQLGHIFWDIIRGKEVYTAHIHNTNKHQLFDSFDAACWWIEENA